jgi:predicted acetyltransferase
VVWNGTGERAAAFIFVNGKNMSKNLILRELAPADEVAFLAAVKDWEGEDLSWFTFEWKSEIKFTDHLERLRKNKTGEDLKPGTVPSTMLYGFVKATGEGQIDGQQIVGRVSVRHSLNDYLRQRGGNLGYSIAPRFRRKGYAGEMVKQTLPYCQKLGLTKLLITCTDSNSPSWRIIESLGGVLENKVFDEGHGETIRRYWLALY